MSLNDKEELTTIKYIIKVRFEVDGVVEKPDVIGAVFGQTEGLLGDELDLRELQKTGRIGRIGVTLELKNGKAAGEITVPSSLDRAETAILAAALETIDRVGPCTARMTLEKIEDVRSVKREKILDRAADILKKWTETVAPETADITEAVMRAIKPEDIVKYGPEELPAGPGLEESDSIIIVEGRADVINLLKHGFRNTVAVEGTNIPKSIIDLCNEKVVTVFTDGDRGGELILKELLQVADIDYVARAPPGKEVEELTRKEIVKCLRNKVPVEQVLSLYKPAYKEHKPQPEHVEEKIKEPYPTKHVHPRRIVKKGRKIKPAISLPDTLVDKISTLPETSQALILNEGGDEIARLPVSELADKLETIERAHLIAFDGVITQRIVDLASQKKIKYLVGARIGKIQKKPAETELITFDDIQKNS
ncbi:MAG: DNA primase DnaG [Candidatus Odinarchaeum yellowstonii]|uniref:DNA primase DnaG n=1 Tax=Odinarchaeota yellowstonii (strain LCB_4) TaxID=1841599 RepID=A0AAF0IBR2_ODILC|nr:MAG: DNA primase DnaG [Candidatus Odinarchaeum yellowstonii]